MPEVTQSDRTGSQPPNVRSQALGCIFALFWILAALLVAAQFIDFGSYDKWFKYGSYAVGVLFLVYAALLIFLKKPYD